jgi:hypothetical protein
MFHILCPEQMRILIYFKDISSKFDIFAGYDILFIGNEENPDHTIGYAARGLHAGGQTLC